jgi:hypothetical protein
MVLQALVQQEGGEGLCRALGLHEVSLTVDLC